jgi:3-deoxy-D-manno-octulosonic-acid transferase
MFIRWLYTLLLLLIAPVFLYGLYKKKPNKPSYGKRWKEHFGFTPNFNAEINKPIWIHTVSVGEAIAATPFIKALKIKFPTKKVIVTTTTSTGAAQIKKLGSLVEHRYMPLDLPFAIKGFLKAINPSALLIMETELWPNTLHYVAQSQIPITIINARLSERSCSRYQQFQSVFDLLANNISKILCQTDQDAQRFMKLGVDKSKIDVTGSIKFDISITQEIKNKALKLKKEITEKRPVWIAASTHVGEDEMLLGVHEKLIKQIPNLLLILVPRHPERFIEVHNLCHDHGFSVVNRAGRSEISTQTQIYLGDTMGDMLILIGASDVCFMAGSLIGDSVGGHNVLEPAILEKPIITGPSYYNFKEIVDEMVDNNACTVCQNADEIGSQLLYLFNSSSNRKRQGKNALNVVEKNRGSINNTLRELEKIKF